MFGSCLITTVKQNSKLKLCCIKILWNFRRVKTLLHIPDTCHTTACMLKNLCCRPWTVWYHAQLASNKKQESLAFLFQPLSTIRLFLNALQSTRAVWISPVQICIYTFSISVSNEAVIFTKLFLTKPHHVFYIT